MRSPTSITGKDIPLSQDRTRGVSNISINDSLKTNQTEPGYIPLKKSSSSISKFRDSTNGETRSQFQGFFQSPTKSNRDVDAFENEAEGNINKSLNLENSNELASRKIIYFFDYQKKLSIYYQSR